MHTDLNVSSIKSKIAQLAGTYLKKLEVHSNPQARNILLYSKAYCFYRSSIRIDESGTGWTYQVSLFLFQNCCTEFKNAVFKATLESIEFIKAIELFLTMPRDQYYRVTLLNVHHMSNLCITFICDALYFWRMECISLK